MQLETEVGVLIEEDPSVKLGVEIRIKTKRNYI